MSGEPMFESLIWNWFGRNIRPILKITTWNFLLQPIPYNFNLLRDSCLPVVGPNILQYTTGNLLEMLVLSPPFHLKCTMHHTQSLTLPSNANINSTTNNKYFLFLSLQQFPTLLDRATKCKIRMLSSKQLRATIVSLLFIDFLLLAPFCTLLQFTRFMWEISKYHIPFIVWSFLSIFMKNLSLTPQQLQYHYLQFFTTLNDPILTMMPSNISTLVVSSAVLVAAFQGKPAVYIDIWESTLAASDNSKQVSKFKNRLLCNVILLTHNATNRSWGDDDMSVA
jgi:hypothetical protein